MEILYKHTEDVHNLTAPREVAPFLFKIFKPSSILDVGCGLGTWLKAFQDLGVEDIVGVDGAYVNRRQLTISESKFVEHDLKAPLNLNRKFDLVLSLEVAEHLPKNLGHDFVKSLVAHGDIVIFSAAIPGQSGQHHINEQPLSYWMAEFKTFGYSYHDIIRPVFWSNKKVDVWYRQNAVVFVKEGHGMDSTLQKMQSSYVDLVHPELFEFYRKRLERADLLEDGKLGVRLAFRQFYKALINII